MYNMLYLLANCYINYQKPWYLTYYFYVFAISSSFENISTMHADASDQQFATTNVQFLI